MILIRYLIRAACYVQILKKKKPHELSIDFLIACIGTEYEKVRKDVTDYNLVLKISKCILVNFEFFILIWNFEL